MAAANIQPDSMLVSLVRYGLLALWNVQPPNPPPLSSSSRHCRYGLVS